MSIRVAVVGAGSWGTTVAALACANAPTTLWCRRPELVEQIRRHRVNDAYLPGFALPAALSVTASLDEAVGGADVVVMAVPSQVMRATLQRLAPSVRPWVPVVSLAKGLERDSHLRMTEIVAQEMPGHPVGALTGPNLAKEILSGHAAASVVAFRDDHIARELQRIFATEVFRVYTNSDVVGCELAGALKNVVAIASGMADGLGAGDNTRAAVITRGLAELARLGRAMGGETVTFAGLAGMGDLVATCMSRHSRNRYVGEQLGRGRPLTEIVAEMATVAEGVTTAGVVVELAERHGVDMPIAREVHGVVGGDRAASDAYQGLLRRALAPELHGLG